MITHFKYIHVIVNNAQETVPGQVNINGSTIKHENTVTSVQFLSIVEDILTCGNVTYKTGPYKFFLSYKIKKDSFVLLKQTKYIIFHSIVSVLSV